jgi:asparagine N-glycosylation enzyme membrane subunit Stt3
MYQNFGAATPAVAGTNYKWNAVNAEVWATGLNGNNAIVSFKNAGNAQVILSASYTGVACAADAVYNVTVGNSVSLVPKVYYFQGHFVCTPANEDFYQWGYDNSSTLDSTILNGEINQDYVNTNPDLKHNNYWVMTGMSGCAQKTYLNAPLAVEDMNSASTSIEVFPNPAGELVTITINSSLSGTMKVEILNMTGQALTTAQVTDNKATVSLAGYAAGIYMVACYRDGVRVATSRLVKN